MRDILHYIGAFMVFWSVCGLAFFLFVYFTQFYKK